jgi:uncharacterized protein (TIGR03066 family)
VSRFITPVAAFLVLTVSVAALAQAPKDSEKKLLGKWKLVKSSKDELPPGLVAIIQFEKGGKFTTHIELKDKKQDVNGTWKFDGKKLTVEYTDGPPKGKKETMEVTKLTDEQLVTVDEKQTTEEFKKVK